VSKYDINEISREYDPDILDSLIELNNSLGYSLILKRKTL